MMMTANITLLTSRQPADRGPEHRAWCFRHGFLTSEVADEICVDPVARTVTVDKLVPVSEPGDPDFPELRRDEHHQPVTERVVFTLREDLPEWVVVEPQSERIAA